MSQKKQYTEIHPAIAFLISIFVWFAVALITIAWHLFGLILISPVAFLIKDKTGRLMHGIARLWARSIIAAAFVWRLKISGRENIHSGERYVIVGNHQSLSDILVVLAALPVHFKFMAKAELFRIPFLGWHMTLARYIPLDRGKKESTRNAVKRSRELIRMGASLLLFPEGTRSMDGKMLPFKSGAFKIAAEEGISVLPVAIDGTGVAIRKKDWMLRRILELRIHILPPVKPEGTDAQSIERIRETTRALIELELEKIRADYSQRSPS